MSLSVLKKICKLEDEDDLHLARVLILIYFVTSFGKKPIAGITKLVKLDFLLRYPKALERGLEYLEKSTDIINIKQYEVENIESKMIRFKYGPWDTNYRTILTILSSKNLIDIKEIKKTTYIELSSLGGSISEKLILIDEFSDYVKRSRIIKSNFSNLPATKLKDLMYDLVPEIKNVKMGEDIVF